MAAAAAMRRVRRRAPRGSLRSRLKRDKAQLRLRDTADLLVHLNCLLFLHRLAEEARVKAFGNKSKIIKTDHVLAAAKVVLKKSRG
ncbi:centromere protein W [Ornithorhynchus anatinus]|uniref:centromere protein W n=1 Tax=Ornithorhynchus anatinus TaxID=9258 RepID=UPI0010A938C1|nr:centromere protein W [Ornithorhynchus anatinus]